MNKKNKVKTNPPLLCWDIYYEYYKRLLNKTEQNEISKNGRFKIEFNENWWFYQAEFN